MHNSFKMEMYDQFPAQALGKMPSIQQGNLTETNYNHNLFELIFLGQHSSLQYFSQKYMTQIFSSAILTVYKSQPYHGKLPFLFIWKWFKWRM